MNAVLIICPFRDDAEERRIDKTIFRVSSLLDNKKTGAISKV